MGTVKKIGHDYYIEFEARGLKYQQKAGPDEGQAWKLLTEIEAKIQNGQMGVITRDVELDIFFKDYLEFISNTYPPKSIQRLSAVIKHFTSFLSVKHSCCDKVSHMTPKIIESYKYEHAQGDVSFKRKRLVNFTLLLLSDIFSYGIKLGYISDNPCLHTPLLNISGGHSVICLEPEDLAVDPVKLFLCETGLRKKEAEGLKRKGIDFKNNVLMVDFYSPQLHPGHNRIIPLTQTALDILTQCDIMDSTSSEFVFENLNLDDRIYPMARNSFARRMLKNGVSLSAAAIYLGLSDIARAVKYMDFIPSIHREIE